MELISFKPIRFRVKDRDGQTQTLEIFEDLQYNLMEILKAWGYKMRATCGGMGLCADCHCRIIEGMDALPQPTDQEVETLDEIPDGNSDSRLACQIKPGMHLHQIYVELLGQDHY